VTEVKRGGPDYNQENFENADDYDGFLAEKMLNDQQFEDLEQVVIPDK
jgi:hypothetical protein